MIKPIIVVHPADSNFFVLPFMREIIDQYFDIRVYDPDQSYDIKTTILAVHHTNRNSWWELWYAQGIKILIDNLNEPNTWYRNFFNNLDPNQHYAINNANWFWYEDVLNFQSHWEYTPVKTYKKLALMPMAREKKHRTRLLEAMTPWLDQCVYSYVAQGINLPKDIDHVENWDRNFVPAWYNDTYFSLVAETWSDNMQEYQMAGPSRIRYNRPTQFITEKTFKPIKYRHPYMIYGQQGTLAYLRSQGFETFENLFDESYDELDNRVWDAPDTKLEIIIRNVDNFQRKPYDALTLEKLEHNYQHMRNCVLVKDRIKKEIVHSILEFIDAK